MLTATFIETGSPIRTREYDECPEKFKGKLVCPDCGEKAWYKRAYSSDIRECMACFCAHHLDECTAGSLVIVEDEEDDAASKEPSDPNSLWVNLDKTSKTIEVAGESDKRDDGDHNWENIKIVSKGERSFPRDKSLKQLLQYLMGNPDYADDKKTIEITADSGRPVISGLLKDFTARLESLGESDLQKTGILYGRLNNSYEDPSGALWLNVGDRKTEPSILIEKNLVKRFLTSFKLKSAEDLAGSQVIIVGTPWRSSKGKISIRLSFTKYISFRKATVTLKQSDEAIA